MNNMEFLLHSDEPWVVCRTLSDLLGMSPDDPAVITAREHMLAHPLIRQLCEEMKQWPGTVVNSHKSAGQLYHKLAFLADMGITAEDYDFSCVSEQLLAHRSNEGLFQSPINIPEHFGGTGTDAWGWALCDAPVLLYSAAKMNLADRTEIISGVRYLMSLARENGWPCAVSSELGSFRGPGRKSDPCPYVNLIMLQLLSLFEEYRESAEAHAGVECLLHAWETSRTNHPYMFFMGTDFRKLKAPFIWYDILHTTEVLSRFDYAVKDERFTDMHDSIRHKADCERLYTAESVWTAWKDWDFGQKKLPSPTITFFVYRIDKRCGL